MKHVCLLLLSWTLFATPLKGQINGTLQGVVTDSTGAALVGASVTVSSRMVGFVENVRTDDRGRYRITNLPLAPLYVQITMQGFAPTDWIDEVRSDVPVVHNVTLVVAKPSEEITVITEPLVDVDSSSSSHIFNVDALERSLHFSPKRAMSSIVKLLPGVVEEENGRLHVRGSEVQPQYVLDGIPIADNLSGIFATELDSDTLRTIQVITGNIPAQFGDKTSAIVNLSTKSGLNAPWNGKSTISGGSFGQADMSLSLGGSIGKFGVFAAADAGRSNRYMDPPDSGVEDDEEEALKGDDDAEDLGFHNKGGLVRLFTRFDWIPSERDAFHSTFSGSGTTFQIPNSLESHLMGQDQRQKLRDDFQSLTWTHVFGPKTVTDVAGSRRSSTARLVDPRHTGFPYFVAQERRQRTEGIRAKLSHEWRLGNIQFGGEAYRYPLQEHFRVAATDPELLEEIEEPIAQFTIDRPFRFDKKKTGSRSALYAENHFRVVSGLTADIGLRFDDYNVASKEHAASPRIGLAYHLRQTNTVFRAAYNRLFQTPPLENVLLSSSADAGTLSRLADSTTARIVPPEKQNYYEFGLQQQVARHFRIDAVRYVKTVRNFSDEQQLLGTGIVFPVSISGADIRGIETRLDLVDLHGFTAYASYANARASIMTPITGGLFLHGSETEEAADSEDQALGIPGLQLPADQDQRNELQFGTTYLHKSGTWVTFNGRFDSGVPAEVEAEDYPSLDPRLQAALDPIRKRIKPRTILNVLAGFRWSVGGRALSIQAGVNNLLNRFYLYNYHSVFSGTHVGRPRELLFRVAWEWQRER